MGVPVKTKFRLEEWLKERGAHCGHGFQNTKPACRCRAKRIKDLEHRLRNASSSERYWRRVAEKLRKEAAARDEQISRLLGQVKRLDALKSAAMSYRSHGDCNAVE